SKRFAKSGKPFRTNPKRDSLTQVDELAMRFRPRFSLKVLMLLVAAIGVFCAYPVHWIHQRREFLKKHEVDAVHFDIITNVDPFSWMKEPWAGGQHCTGLSTLSNVIRRKAPRHTSTLLRLFGEQEFREVKLVFRSYSLPENPVDRNESWA